MGKDDTRPLQGEILPPERPRVSGRRRRELERERKRWAFLEEPGRDPSKLSASRLRRMLEAREQGDSITDACRAVGIDTKTHANWMERGRLDDEAGRDTLCAEYFRKVPVAAQRGKVERRRFILSKIRAGGDRNLKQAREMMRYDAQVEAGRLGQQTLRLKREALKQGVPVALPPPPQEEEAPPLDLTLLTPEEWADFQRIEARLRADFASVSQADMARLQLLLRKGRGQEGQHEEGGPHVG